ncbi:MAG: right-handed parallel beta-helix repeat-containing protein [Pirellulaceae bacterium]
MRQLSILKIHLKLGLLLVIALSLTSVTTAQQNSVFVAPNGNDSNPGTLQQPFGSIQHALNTATKPGSRIFVRGGVYHERIEFVASGNARDGHIVLRNYPGETPILDGTGVAGQDMVVIENLHHIRFLGFEIRNNLNVTDGSGIRVLGYGHHIELRDNTIHDMRGSNAMGITVYGTSTQQAIAQLFIYNNHIYDCEPAPSEALTVNGNVNRFTIANNLVHDVNNIAIDAIGGEVDINPNPNLVARAGLIRDNIVYNAHSSYGGGFGAGIYVDGGRNIRIESNHVYNSDMGIEIGAENQGIITRNVQVLNNVIDHNDKAGIVFGGYAADTGRVERCRFYNNTLVQNDFLNEGYGQIWVQFANDCVIVNNIIWSSDSGVLLNAEGNSFNNLFDYNNWFCEFGQNNCEFIYEGNSYLSFSAFKAGSGQDVFSVFANPLFLNPGAGDYSLLPNSPAIDMGTAIPGWYGPSDMFDSVRPQGDGVDIGAIESTN